MLSNALTCDHGELGARAVRETAEERRNREMDAAVAAALSDLFGARTTAARVALVAALAEEADAALAKRLVRSAAAGADVFVLGYGKGTLRFYGCAAARSRPAPAP